MASRNDQRKNILVFQAIRLPDKRRLNSNKHMIVANPILQATLYPAGSGQRKAIEFPDSGQKKIRFFVHVTKED